jgi:hypothetical protein
MTQASVETLHQWKRRQSGSMPDWASNMLAVPFSSVTSQRFLDASRSWGKRDHSGRSGWHVASRLFLDPDISD